MVSVYDHGSPYTQPRLVPSAGRNSFRLNRRKVYTYGPKAGDLCARCTRTRICDGTPYRLLSQGVPADACVGGGADSIMVRRIFINVFSLCAALSHRIKVRFADANRLRRTERCQNTRCIPGEYSILDWRHLGLVVSASKLARRMQETRVDLR